MLQGNNSPDRFSSPRRRRGEELAPNAPCIKPRDLFFPTAFEAALPPPPTSGSFLRGAAILVNRSCFHYEFHIPQHADVLERVLFNRDDAGPFAGCLRGIILNHSWGTVRGV